MLEKQEAQGLLLGGEDPLEEDTAICSSTFAWEIPWTEEPGRLQSTGSQSVRHNCVHVWACAHTHIHTHTHTHTHKVNQQFLDR